MAIGPDRRLFTVEEYHRMGEAGILGPDDRVELIDGEIIERPVMGPRHASVVTRFATLLMHVLAQRAIVRIQLPVTIPTRSEPEPDIALVLPRDDFYEGGHPSPADVSLLIEVADASLWFDRARKVPMYLGAGVPEVWLADLVANAIEVYRPGSEFSVVRRGDTLAPAAFPDVVVAVSDVLG